MENNIEGMRIRGKLKKILRYGIENYMETACVIKREVEIRALWRCRMRVANSTLFKG